MTTMRIDERQILDKENMLGMIDALPEQLGSAFELGMQLPLPQVKEIRHVLIAGMGGSAIGGDLLAGYLKDKSPVPISILRDYELPTWAKGQQVMVICSSHSGNTEEVLSVFKQALASGCSVFALSTGGQLARQAQELQVPFWQFDHQGQPRTAVGFSFGMLLALMIRLGLVQDLKDEVTDAIATMQAQRQVLGYDVQTQENPAKQVAEKLVGHVLTIFGAGAFEVVARRWKTQINELAKAWAAFESLPEADHNTLASSVNPQKALKNVAAIFLRSKFDHFKNNLRLAATSQAFEQDGLVTVEVLALGETRLAQIWSLLQMGDYVSYYLALHYGIDPTPVEALAKLKQLLSRS